MTREDLTFVAESKLDIDAIAYRLLQDNLKAQVATQVAIWRKRAEKRNRNLLS